MSNIYIFFFIRKNIDLKEQEGKHWGSCYSIFGFMCIVCRLLFVPLVLFHLATVDCPSVFCVIYVNLPGMSEVLCLRSSQG
jgi:hypothetical protein